MFGAIFAYPAFLTVVTSLKTQDAVLEAPLALPDHVTFEAYVTTWQTLRFGTYSETAYSTQPSAPASL